MPSGRAPLTLFSINPMQKDTKHPELKPTKVGFVLLNGHRHAGTHWPEPELQGRGTAALGNPVLGPADSHSNVQLCHQGSNQALEELPQGWLWVSRHQPQLRSQSTPHSPAPLPSKMPLSRKARSCWGSGLLFGIIRGSGSLGLPEHTSQGRSAAEGT